MLSSIPQKVIELSQQVRALGGRALLVGGCVRDFLMGVEPKDWDVEVYGVEPAPLRALLEQFGRVDAVGEAFTVYKLGSDLDVSLPRRERKMGRGHRAFRYFKFSIINYNNRICFKEPLSSLIPLGPY